MRVFWGFGVAETSFSLSRDKNEHQPSEERKLCSHKLSLLSSRQYTKDVAKSVLAVNKQESKYARTLRMGSPFALAFSIASCTACTAYSASLASNALRTRCTSKAVYLAPRMVTPHHRLSIWTHTIYCKHQFSSIFC